MIMHYMKGNKGKRVPSHLVALSVEVGPAHNQASKEHIELRMFEAAIISSRRERGEWTRRKCLIWQNSNMIWDDILPLCHPRRTALVVCHGLTMALTATRFWTYVDTGTITIDSIVDADPPVIIRCHSERGPMVLCDLRNWFRCTMDDIREMAKEDQSYYGSIAITSGTEFTTCIVNAIATDCAVKSLMAMVADRDLGNFRYTISGQAWAAYRHRFAVPVGPASMIAQSDLLGKDTMEPKFLPLFHDCSEITELERRACYGGEARCFFVGKVCADPIAETTAMEFSARGDDYWPKGPLYAVDVNSLLPYVMASKYYPVRLVGSGPTMSMHHLQHNLQNSICIADVEISCIKDTFPVRVDGRVLYASGKYWTTLCASELEYAVMLGAISEIGTVAVYEKRNLFQRYVEELYAMKREFRESKQNAQYQLVKVLLNSLYGVWGKRAHRWEEVKHPRPLRRWGRWYKVDYVNQVVTLFRALGDCVQRQMPRGETSNSFPAIMACVASNGRQYMRGLRSIAGQPNIFYQGGDSLIVDSEGMARLRQYELIHESKLGYLRVQRAAERGWFRNVRQYSLDDTVVQSGLPVNAHQVDQFTAAYVTRPRLASVIDQGPQSLPYESHHTGTWSTSYDSGIVTKSGFVTPLILNREEAYADYTRRVNARLQKGAYPCPQTPGICGPHDRK